LAQATAGYLPSNATLPLIFDNMINGVYTLGTQFLLTTTAVPPPGIADYQDEGYAYDMEI
jgi:hypothetical protein